MTASVTGPVTGGSRGWPFSLPRTDLDAIGYVAEEFFLDGTATAYEAEPGADLGIDGKWSVRPSRSAPFRTRMLVVRPSDPARFNGIVHVNWQNVTAGFEIGTADSDQILDGFAWVGVSAQRAGLEGFPGMEQVALKGWDPERYGTLHHPGDDFSFDIYTQARAIASSTTGATLGGLTPEKLVASGGSQSAMRLRTYANAIQPLEHVFDAFWFLVDFGKGSVPDTSSVDRDGADGNPAHCAGPDSRRPRCSVVRVQQRDGSARGLSGTPARFGNAAPLGGRGHLSHGGVSSQTAMAELFERRHRVRARWRAGSTAAPENPNVLSFTPANRAAFQHFHTWIRGGAAPPSQPRIEFESADPPTIRDRFGNALGGIRLPDFAVPTGEHMGTGKGDVLASLVGYSRPFTPEELAELYPNREAYLSRWHAALDHGVEAGFILPEDAGDEGRRRRDRGDGVPEIGTTHEVARGDTSPA